MQLVTGQVFGFSLLFLLLLASYGQSAPGAAQQAQERGVAAADANQSSFWTMLKLPDTGQTGHFTATFGEDCDCAINLPSFVNNGDGTVTDQVSGLIWQQADGPETTWEKAGTYCRSLSLAGYQDWRLPFAHELFSIVNHNMLNPALDTTVFARTSAEYWWTTDQRSDDKSVIWVVNAGGGIGPHPMNETISAGGSKRFQVRCVRIAVTVDGLFTSFTDSRDGTVTDNRTGLIWQKAEAAEAMTWEEALKYAEALSLGGRDDWRLPNIKELQSFNDDHRTRPSIDTAYFPGATPSEYWSSTTLVNQPSRAWTVDFTYGIGSYKDKTERLRVRSVRGGFKGVAAVSAASYVFNAPVAPASLASAFGEGLAASTAVAETVPLPA
jgi:hypothetical protein